MNKSSSGGIDKKTIEEKKESENKHSKLACNNFLCMLKGADRSFFEVWRNL
jgi:hypothetical protein